MVCCRLPDDLGAFRRQREVSEVVRKSEVTTLSIYIPKSKLDRKPIERLDRLAKRVDRSINYLVVEAILQYLDREERKKK